mgnify:CR=1 FL=1
MPIESRQDLLMKTLQRYYKNPKTLETLVQVVHNPGGVSLRVIDYLCTNYAKTHDIVYYVDKKIPFNLYLQYRSQLKAYSKMQFDPFRRHERITIPVPTSMISSGVLETTVAQLNFFKWAIENKVISYIQNPGTLKKIEAHMNSAPKQAKSKQNSSKRNVSASTKRHNMNVTVSFK